MSIYNYYRRNEPSYEKPSIWLPNNRKTRRHKLKLRKVKRVKK